uniref:Hedgehog protein n=1 Tax=Cupiennius salei TaxID=6928 RepID=A0A0U5KQ23_CUPSA|nr:hedgehog B transcription factor [Cupiennius salei]
MLEKIPNSISLLPLRFKLIFVVVLCLIFVFAEVNSCSPGRSGARRRSTRKLTPLVFKQHVPNVPEHSIGASGPPEGRIWRDDVRFKNLVPNYNSDIVFKDEEGTGVDRLMTPRCKEKLDILAISVMNMWPGVRLRVTEGFDEDGHHPQNSLHYEGRAVAISTSDRDTSKYGMLARLAVDAGFDWVFYESRTHIYCSVKTESTVPSTFSGCFHGTSQVITKTGKKFLHELEVGEEILSSEDSRVLSFSKVIGFLHRDPYFPTNFIRLHTSNHTLLVTNKHLVFQRNEAVFAEEIITGDVVLIASNNGTLSESVVTAVNYSYLRGVYAPMTETGTVVVDGILNSCYAVIDNHDLAHFAFLPLRLMHKAQDSVPLVINEIFKFVIAKVWPIDVLKWDDNTTEDPYIHSYVKFLCGLSGLFVTICK